MSPIFPQGLLDLHDELIVDLFAGGGGASCGIEMATGRQVDVAINHDAAAVSLHEANHPQTRHYVSDVFEVDPREVAGGRPIGLLWASPDCTDHSKAKGGKPIRTRKRRALAWVVKRWAGQVRPRVIVLENVEEFAEWGPLIGQPGKLRRCPKRKGKTFRRFVRELERLGYAVEWRELKGHDYGAPTIRKRLFLIARCDGRPIVWPERTHGPGTRRKYRTAAECVDWSIPMLSIFATREEAKAWGRAHGQPAPKRPLADATMRRIARGVMRYVVENPKPFIVGVGGRQGQSPERSVDESLQTVTAKADSAIVAPVIAQLAHGEGSGRTRRWGIGSTAPDEPVPTIMAGGNSQALVAPYLVPRYGERAGQEPRIRSLEEPAPVVVPTGNGGSLVAAHLQRDFGNSVGQAANEPVGTITPGGGGKTAVVASFLAKHYGGNELPGWSLDRPISSVTTQDHHHLVTAHLSHQYTSNTNGGAGDVDRPLKTQTTGNHAALVYAFLQSYYGTENRSSPADPLPTIPTHDRFGLVTVNVAGEPYVIVDIAMRMLQPRELYRAQGFPDSYVIDRGADGRRLTKTEQVRMVGNSVCPPIAAALVRANVPEMIVRPEAAKGKVA